MYKAREDLIAKVTNEAEAAMTKGSVQWDYMKKLRTIYHGCKPAQSQDNTVLDENGNILNSHGDVYTRPQRHFLNVPGSFDAEVVNSMVQLPVRNHLDIVPSYEEAQVAVHV